MAAGILDGGDDAIFLGENRFKKFMETVDELVVNRGTVEGEDKAFGETSDVFPGGLSEETSDEVTRPESGHNQTNVTGEPKESSDSRLVTEIAIADPQQLIKSGMEFLSGLSAALSKPESTRQLIDSIITEDTSDGKTFLKIPVENRQTAENIFAMLGKIMQTGR